MYSNNDYRYYLEHRLAMSDDFLAHYGVKGMKWKEHRLKNVVENSWDQAQKKTKSASKKAKRIMASAEKKARITSKKAGKKVKRTVTSAETKAKTTGKKIKKTAKKAYKYADDHVDGYTYNTKKANSRSLGAGVRVKTKKSTTEVGVYGKGTTVTTKKGKRIPIGGDLGIEIGRDNKKKRKISYVSGGVGTRYGIPVSVYRRGSKKY